MKKDQPTSNINIIKLLSMSLKVNRIKAFLDKTFDGLIDLTDIQKKPLDEQKKMFYSRSLAAFSLLSTCGISAEEAGIALVDGYDDGGIDAIYFDGASKNLWLVQSKFIENGSGGLDNGDIEKFAKGVRKLINADFSRFNKKVKDRSDEISEALDDPKVKIQLLLCYTSNNLSTHNKASIEDILREQNDADELLLFHNFNLDRAYKALEIGVSYTPIDEDITITDWGHIEEPLKSYYGLINGADLAALFSKYGKRLFTENIRSFLGNSDANYEIIRTIKNEPYNFIYFNNGITILCSSINKKPLGGNTRSFGSFACSGLSVVNGAQTLGSIGSLTDKSEIDLSKIKVLVRLISLEGSPEGFNQRITIATNTQNKVEKKDFVSLDTVQSDLRIDLKTAGIDYHFKRSDEKITSDDNNYILEEVAFSLASLNSNVDYSTIVKKESGRLWENVQEAPYIDLFNSQLSAQKVIKAVRIYRYISNEMRILGLNSEGRQRSINKYGNSLVAHVVFQKMSKALLADDNSNFEMFFQKDLPILAKQTIDDLHSKIEVNFPDSMIVYVLRNYNKCRQLKDELAQPRPLISKK